VAGSASGELVGALRARGIDAWGIENNRAAHAQARRRRCKSTISLGSIGRSAVQEREFDFVYRDEPVPCHGCAGPDRACANCIRVVKTGLVFGSVTSDLPAALIDQYNLLRGVKKLGTWWEWSELFFNSGFDLSMNRRDVTDALWEATIAANKGPGHWYADADSLRYSFFDKTDE
jgi:hypothetical protein